MMIRANKNLNILLQVCDYTGYEVSFKNNKIVCIDTYGSKKVFEYDNIENALIGWLPTMEEQQEGADEDVDMWSKEIRYVKQMKKQLETKKFLYSGLDIDFKGNTTEEGFGLSCEFELDSIIKPMLFVQRLCQYSDSEYEVSDAYVEFTCGRIEQDEETGHTVIYIFEPSMDSGGIFLHESKMLHYNPMELQEEIIKRWKEYSK